MKLDKHIEVTDEWSIEEENDRMQREYERLSSTGKEKHHEMVKEGAKAMADAIDKTLLDEFLGIKVIQPPKFLSLG